VGTRRTDLASMPDKSTIRLTGCRPEFDSDPHRPGLGVRSEQRGYGSGACGWKRVVEKRADLRERRCARNIHGNNAGVDVSDRLRPAAWDAAWPLTRAIPAVKVIMLAMVRV